MDFLMILTLILGNGALIIPLFLWNRSESRADIRHMDAKIEAYMSGIRQEIKAIHEEMKDFHIRMCAIEERNKK
jgi:hypothetical protein